MSTSQCPFKSHPMRPGLEEPPNLMVGLPNDHRGYPVPFFVDWLDHDTPEFRAFDPRKLLRCVKENLCWTCGKPLWREKVFVIGPMCAINHINSEPPNHRECALYSVRNCPFLSRPHMVRREDGLPEGTISHAAGTPILRNPGATCMWFCRRYRIVKVDAVPGMSNRGILFDLGTPFKVQWWACGRPATRSEVMDSIESGLPLLYEANDREQTEERRGEGRRMIDRRFVELKRLLPTA